ncbi:glycosyltransferase family 1 protein [Nocardioides sp. CFH 31398]|uniref:glycosyltransferase family 1 protein n=1 Tax=Nocardioides sp. CFH 31398 TaxID=2919579 RepID=UPI001F06ABD4|nr:glycosyltransferase family 1 protein [Nocardioides sp. CFH 31398]MCH1868715.1 glycosyltransferase family 1 protein [Nocardioides sp. CFH 31398]
MPQVSGARTAVAVRPIEVVSVPAGHPYVQQAIAAGTDVVLRPDPDPDDPTRPATGRWWPPVALDPTWVADQAFDVLHLHFGYDDRSPAELGRLADVLDAKGVPLVLTLHDLRNPHHEDPALLQAQLDVLVPRAADLVTLTEAAADVVADRWGRRPLVLPHPHLVDLGAMAEIRAERRRRAEELPAPVVGLAIKELRRSSDPLRLLPTLVDVVRRHPAARLRVTVHEEVRHPDRLDRDPAACAVVEALDDLAHDPGGEHVDVVWHERLSDADLWRELAGQHVAVLPYRHGTHSGWLEACHDVGTRVLAPSSGCYGSQGADAVFTADEDSVDTDSLAEALTGLLRQPSDVLAGDEPSQRATQREAVARAHGELYAAVLDGARSRGTVPAGGAA